MPTPPDRSTCNVLGLCAFGPGYHKVNGFYSANSCDTIVTNFRRLAGYLTPLARLGHDVNERLQDSLGFINCGKVTSADPIPGYPGYVSIDIRGVPVEIGEQISAGRICGVSVELVTDARDPTDNSKKLPGNTMTAVSFLGEEQPAVKSYPPALWERAKPKATFPDGSPVPPARDCVKWLAAMASVLCQTDEGVRRMTARIGDRDYPVKSVAFAQMYAAPPTPAAKPVPPQSRPVPPSVPPTKRFAMSSDPAMSMSNVCKKFADDPGQAETMLRNLGVSDDMIPQILAMFGVPGYTSPVETMASDDPNDPDKKETFSAVGKKKLTAGGRAMMDTLRVTNPRVAAKYV